MNINQPQGQPNQPQTKPAQGASANQAQKPQQNQQGQQPQQNQPGQKLQPNQGQGLAAPQQKMGGQQFNHTDRNVGNDALKTTLPDYGDKAGQIPTIRDTDGQKKKPQESWVGKADPQEEVSAQPAGGKKS